MNKTDLKQEYEKSFDTYCQICGAEACMVKFHKNIHGKIEVKKLHLCEDCYDQQRKGVD